MLLLLGLGLDLGPFVEGPDPVINFVACSPLGGFAERVGALPAPLLNAFPGDLKATLTNFTESSEGINRDGAVFVATWADRQEVSIPFTGDRAQAQAWLGAQGEVAVEGDVFVVRRPDASVHRWRLGGGALTLTEAHQTAAVGPFHPAMLADVPDQPGCLLFTRELRPGSEKIHGLTASLPFSGAGTILLRLDAAAPPPKAFAQPSGPWVGAATRQVPEVVGGIGVSGDDLLTLLAANPKAPAQDIARLRAVLRLPGGATFAVFGVKPTPRYALVIPVQDPDGAPLSARRAAKLAAAFAGDKLHKVGRGAYEGELPTPRGPIPLAVAVAPGKIILASDLALAAEVIEGAGADWLDPRLREWSQTWPLAVGTVGDGPLSFQAGLKAHDGLWEMQFALPPLPAGQPNLFAMMMVTAAQQIMEAKRRVDQTGLAEAVEGLRAAELAYTAAHGAPLALPPAPRATPSPQAVPWVAAGGWEQLGWAPPPGLGAAVFWVDVQAGAFTVHGAVDADGDGVPATSSATETRGATMDTAPSVF